MLSNDHHPHVTRTGVYRRARRIDAALIRQLILSYQQVRVKPGDFQARKNLKSSGDGLATGEERRFGRSALSARQPDAYEARIPYPNPCVGYFDARCFGH